MLVDNSNELPGSLRGDDKDYTGYRRIGIRLTEPFNQLLVESRNSLDSMDEFSKGLHWFDKAHAIMLIEENIIPNSGAKDCLLALKELASTGIDNLRDTSSGGKHSGEAFLIQKLGMDIGGLIHAGRSSWDLGLVSHRVKLRSVALELMDSINCYRKILLDKARQYTDDVMPYYTHGQQAQPTTLAHHLHAFVAAAERDWLRMDGVYKRIDISAAGVAAGTASRFPVNRDRVAQLMGFNAVSTNTRDSGYNYDHLWEMGASLGILMENLNFLCEELILWMGNEYGMIQLSDRYCSTSSIMTQKRNPTAAEHVQEISKRIAGRIPISYTAPELVEDAKHVIDAINLCAGMIESMRVSKDKMLKLTVNSWAQAADLAALLVQEKGLSWRVAHQIIGIMVRLAEEEELSPGHPTPELQDRASNLFLGKTLNVDKEFLNKGLDPNICISTRTAVGSPGPKEMKNQISNSVKLVNNDDLINSERKKHIENAEKLTDEVIDKILK